MADSDTVPERRVARDGHSYTTAEFRQHYGLSWEQYWNECASLALPRPIASSSTRSRSSSASRAQSTTAATSRADGSELAADGGNVSQLAGDGGNVSQLAVNSIRLDLSMVIQVRQQEAARGPPRSVHRLAREALNRISQKSAYIDENLDDCFPWVPYVAAHASCDQIIGPGITHAMARFLPPEMASRDLNRGGAPRCDFCFYRVDGSMCRVHPGKRTKDDAQLIFH